MMGFPVETVPDGSVFHPHHFVYGAIIALGIALKAWDDYRDKEPYLVVGGISLSLFSWYHLWPVGRPISGAVGVLLGIGISLSAVLLRPFWKHEWDRRHRVGVVVFLLVALDDALSHAFGIPTPLDLIWKVFNLTQYFQ